MSETGAILVLPHFMAGFPSGRQRLGFLRWHIRRHRTQVDRTVQASIRS
jgi:hypothetical protein